VGGGGSKGVVRGIKDKIEGPGSARQQLGEMRDKKYYGFLSRGKVIGKDGEKKKTRGGAGKTCDSFLLGRRGIGRTTKKVGSPGTRVGVVG